MYRLLGLQGSFHLHGGLALLADRVVFPRMKADTERMCLSDPCVSRSAFCLATAEGRHGRRGCPSDTAAASCVTSRVVDTEADSVVHGRLAVTGRGVAHFVSLGAAEHRGAIAAAPAPPRYFRLFRRVPKPFVALDLVTTRTDVPRRIDRLADGSAEYRMSSQARSRSR